MGILRYSGLQGLVLPHAESAGVRETGVCVQQHQQQQHEEVKQLHNRRFMVLQYGKHTCSHVH
jgi:hypothetical protein